MAVNLSVSTTGENNMEFLHCIEHEGEVLVQDSTVGMCHEYTVSTEFGVESDWCFFNLGWATCPEPEARPDWELDFEYVEEDTLEVV
jgi:hypothetical protein